MIAEELLAGTADLLEQGGWVQHVLQTANGMCLMQAFSLVVVQNAPEFVEYQKAWNAMKRETGVEALPEWNDAPGRTKEEVVTTIRNAKRWLGDT